MGHRPQRGQSTALVVKLSCNPQLIWEVSSTTDRISGGVGHLEPRPSPLGNLWAEGPRGASDTGGLGPCLVSSV
jgi:hypothetical protein